MAENKKDAGFTVNDRRLFTTEGDLRTDVAEEPPRPAAPPAPAARAEPTPVNPPEAVPEPPTVEEQKVQAAAYDQSNRDLDARLAAQPGAPRAQDLEMTFERLLSSLYMSALYQLGLTQEQGRQSQIDLLGARQTIDTIGLLAEKTRGNLTPAEQNFLQNCLYELRMAYLDMTNALTRPSQPPGPASGPTLR
jgi:hypothetical protein